jgi:hypothetical protein
MRMHPSEGDKLIAWIGRNEAMALIATLEFGVRLADKDINRTAYNLHTQFVIMLRQLEMGGGGFLTVEPRDPPVEL